MKILVDMNLSPIWVSVFESHGIEAVHWSEIGEPNASDTEIFNVAKNENYIVFTHDLDFGDILAATGAVSPSVIQVRTDDTSPQALESIFITAIKRFESHLTKGALITIDYEKSRARVLPIERLED